MKGTKKAQRKPRPPARSEIARILWQKAKVKVEVKGLRGPSIVERDGLQFWVQAVGPQGRYTAYLGEPFEAQSGTDRISAYIIYSNAANAALNELIKSLWKDGWQPTSFGRLWHDFNFRRVVPEPDEPESLASDTTSQPSASAAVTAPTPPPPPPTLPAAFQQIETAYLQVRADYAAGRLNPEQYRNALEKLKVQDQQGRYWMIDGKSGKWLIWDGKAWVQSDPIGK